MTESCHEEEVQGLCPATCEMCASIVDGLEVDTDFSAKEPNSDSKSMSTSLRTTIFVVSGVIAVSVILVCASAVLYVKRKKPPQRTLKAPGRVYGLREGGHFNTVKRNPVVNFEGGYGAEVEELAWEPDGFDRRVPSHSSQSAHSKSRYSDNFRDLARNLQNLDSGGSNAYSHTINQTKNKPSPQGNEMSQTVPNSKQDQVASAAATFDNNPGVRNAFVQFMMQLNMDVPSTDSSSDVGFDTLPHSQRSGRSSNNSGYRFQRGESPESRRSSSIAGSYVDVSSTSTMPRPQPPRMLPRSQRGVITTEIEENDPSQPQCHQASDAQHSADDASCDFAERTYDNYNMMMMSVQPDEECEPMRIGNNI